MQISARNVLAAATLAAGAAGAAAFSSGSNADGEYVSMPLFPNGPPDWLTGALTGFLGNLTSSFA